MTLPLLVIGAINGAIILLITLLPCPACKARRERLRKATPGWRASRHKNT